MTENSKLQSLGLSDYLSIKPEDIIFDCSTQQANKNILTNITLKNKSRGYIAYKIKTTFPKNYLVRPNIGYLALDESITIEISALGSAIPNIQTIAQDKFLIMCISSSDNNEPLEKFWKNVPSSAAHQQKLMVQLKNFEGVPITVTTPKEVSATMRTEIASKQQVNDKSSNIQIKSSNYYDSENFKSLTDKSNFKEGTNFKSQINDNSRIVSSSYNQLDNNEKEKNLDIDYQKRYEEILAKVDEQEKLLYKLNQDRNKLNKELAQYKNITFKQMNPSGVDQEAQFGFQLWHVLLAAIISLLVGALLSSK